MKYPIFAVLTLSPTDALREIHNRMPLILPESAMDEWISPDGNPLIRLLLKNHFRKEYAINTDLPLLISFYMTEKHMDDLSLAHKCNITPINIVIIKKGCNTYSQQIVENLGRGLELCADELSRFISISATGFKYQ